MFKIVVVLCGRTREELFDGPSKLHKDRLSILIISLIVHNNLKEEELCFPESRWSEEITMHLYVYPTRVSCSLLCLGVYSTVRYLQKEQNCDDK